MNNIAAMDNMMQIGLPAVILIFCLYYAFRLLKDKDPSIIRGASAPKLRQPAQYAVDAGKLLLFFAAGDALSIGLYFLYPLASIAEILVWSLIFVVLWMRLNKKYTQQ